jgi:hypothetical protein
VSVKPGGSVCHVRYIQRVRRSACSSCSSNGRVDLNRVHILCFVSVVQPIGWLFAGVELKLDVKWTETHCARLYYRNLPTLPRNSVFGIVHIQRTGLSRVRISTGTDAGYLFLGFQGPSRAYNMEGCACVCVCV